MTILERPEDGAALVAEVASALGARPLALLAFGSCLSETTARPGSVPDLLALVPSVDAALAALGAGRLVRRAARVLPPATVALADAKLNLVTPGEAAAALATLPDLYLAGRLGKRTLLLDATPEGRAIADALAHAAARAMAGAALLGLPRRVPLAAVVRRCLALSYEAEVRPEPPAKVDALLAAAPAHHEARYLPLLRALAASRGLALEDGVLVDVRPALVRAAERLALARLLARGKARAVARWPKQLLLYDGALAYVAGKLRRSAMLRR